MTLQKAVLTDLNTIISWIPDEKELRLWAGPGIRFPLIVDKLSKDIGFQNENAYCIKKTGTLVAFGQLLPKKDDRVHLARIIVSPAERGKGYGKTLCFELIQKAAQKKYKKITLNVYRQNVNAFNLYSSLGFHEVPDKSSAVLCHMVKNNDRIPVIPGDVKRRS